jgi:hypothetical protein
VLGEASGTVTTPIFRPTEMFGGVIPARAVYPMKISLSVKEEEEGGGAALLYPPLVPVDGFNRD